MQWLFGGKQSTGRTNDLYRLNLAEMVRYVNGVYSSSFIIEGGRLMPDIFCILGFSYLYSDF